MTISYISSAAANAASVTMPSHQLGDVLILAAYRFNSNANPTFVAGWQPVNILAGSATNALSVAIKIAASGSEVSGTWTNATQIAVAVYRSANFIISRTRNVTAQDLFSTSSVVYNNISTGSVGTSCRYVGIAGIRAGDSDIETPPSGMVNRVFIEGGAATTGGLVIHDTNGEQDGWTSTTHTLTTGSPFAGRTVVIELADSGVAIPTGSGGGGPLIFGRLAV